MSVLAGQRPGLVLHAVSGRLYALNVAMAGTLTLGLPLLAYTRLLLCHFYVRGGFVLDSGLFAALLWHRDLALTQPASVGGGSFFATHTALIFVPLTALSWLLPLTPAQYFALVFGACHALLALCGFWPVLAADPRRWPLTPWLAALAGLGLAFSGLTIAIARYPHFELLIPVCFLLFATAWRRGRMKLAIGLFVCGLLVREDAGLHYLGVLGLMFALDARRGVAWREQRVTLAFALAALLYSLTALAVQHVAFPLHGSAFARVYLGNPPLAHLTAAHVAWRGLYLLVNRPYVTLPALAALAWAWLARAPFVAIGNLACMPWLVLQLLAASPFASAWASYYVFPCVIGLAWPLLAAQYRRAGTASPRMVLAGYAVLVALSFVPGHDIHDPGRLPIPAAFLTPAPSLAWQAATERAVAAVSAARPLLGRLRVDNSVAALAPDAFCATEIDLTPGVGRGPDKVPPDAVPATVVFFGDGYDADRLRALADGAGLAWRYAIPGTPLHLAAARPLDAVPGLSPLLAAE
jgi:hypothetical protein